MVLYIWHILTLFTIPFVRGNASSAAGCQHLSSATGQRRLGFGTSCERREEPSHTSAQSLPCCHRAEQRRMARGQSLEDPQTSFCFGVAANQITVFIFFKLQQICLGEETKQTELTDVLQWNCGLILMYFEKGKKN